MKYLKILFLSGSLIFIFKATANLASKDLIAIFKPINTIQGHFTQVIEDQNGQTISTSQGRFILQRPDHFRWEVLTPFKQLMIANGKTFWLYQPDLQQVTKSPMSKKIGQTPLAILSGSTKALTEHYQVSKKGDTFILIPKTKATQFHRIELTLDGRKISQMILMDSFLQKTILTFNHIRLNQSVKPQIFTFTPPKGVDVIKG